MELRIPEGVAPANWRLPATVIPNELCSELEFRTFSSGLGRRLRRWRGGGASRTMRSDGIALCQGGPMCAPADVTDLTTLVPSFAALLQPFRAAMTAPTFASLVTVLAGWLTARRRTVTGALACGLAAAATAGRGAAPGKHHSAYHRVFAAARWSLDAVGLGVLGVILAAGLAGGATVFLAADDTL